MIDIEERDMRIQTFTSLQSDQDSDTVDRMKPRNVQGYVKVGGSPEIRIYNPKWPRTGELCFWCKAPSMQWSFEQQNNIACLKPNLGNAPRFGYIANPRYSELNWPDIQIIRYSEVS